MLGLYLDAGLGEKYAPVVVELDDAERCQDAASGRSNRLVKNDADSCLSSVKTMAWFAGLFAGRPRATARTPFGISVHY